MTLALIMPYYMNPGMLSEHYARWRAYAQDVRERTQIIIVDDGSPTHPAVDVPRPENLNIAIYRVLKDYPWHQHGARNLGAWVAQTKWLLLTDMDHIVPEATVKACLLGFNPKCVHMFSRVDAPHLTVTLDRLGQPKPHPNTWLMTRELYWKIGGYDEFFCGHYGTDSLFRARVREHARIQLHDENVIRVPREVIPDASTTTLLRKEGRRRGDRARLIRKKQLSDHADRVLTLQFEWERVV